MNRISKQPEVRKKEILETAKKIFLEKGYEKTSMSDIANELKITQGLCYRYFKSKQELFETAIDEYANECSAKYINIINDKNKNCIEKIEIIFNMMIELENCNGSGSDYHKKGNKVLHEQLELKILMTIKGAAKDFLIDLQNEGFCEKIDNVDSMISFILYGIFGVLKCNNINTQEKFDSIVKYLSSVLGIEIKNIVSK